MAGVRKCVCGKSQQATRAGQYKIVMVRHGESEWNSKNLFCGWVNVNLSEKGLEEAHRAGIALKNAGYKFDLGFTSKLLRAQVTLNTILTEIGQTDIPIIKNWHLNERHYGRLTGLNKSETAAEYGEEQVQIWRRSFDIPPPAMEPNHPYYDQIVNDPMYADGPSPQEFPKFESLKLTMIRVLPFWTDVIVPEIKAGKRILIAAHGNSLRSLVKHLEDMNDEEIMNIELPTGIPFVYTLDENLRPVPNGSMQFIGDPDTVKMAIENVKKQGKSK